MSTFFALGNLKHNGKRYFRGDQLSIEQEAQAQALLNAGVVSEDEPVEEEPEANRRDQSPEEKAQTREAKGKNFQEETPDEETTDDADETAGSDEVSFADMTVAQLREECETRELPTSGTKAELIERLQAV